MRNLHPAYCSLLVKFDALKLRHDELDEILRGYIRGWRKWPFRSRGWWKYRCVMAGSLGRICRMWLSSHGMTAERGDRAACFDDLYSLFFGICAGICVPRGSCGRVGHAAAGDAAEKRTGRKRGHRGESDGRVSDLYAGRMEIARTYAGGDVSAGEGGDESAVDWRSRAIRRRFRGSNLRNWRTHERD